MRKRRGILLAIILLLMLLFSGCKKASPTPSPGNSGSSQKPSQQQTSKPGTQSKPGKTSSASSSGAKPGKTSPAPTSKPYTPPVISEAVFHKSKAEGKDGALIDVSAVSEGYVAVSAKSDSRLKFQVILGEITYTYDLPNDGTETFYGLQSGDGEYQFNIMENVGQSMYLPLFSTSAKVKLKDEFQPFLRKNQYADYSKSSACVKKAAEITADCSTEMDAILAVYSYICKNITYDYEKAKNVQKGYIPAPDTTLSTGKGICFDYASLAASMLRSLGVPTKIIFGYVKDVYHAWNMFYTEETGWVSVEFTVTPGDWTRIDCTFAANGADPKTIGDGKSYTDVYVY